MNLVARLKSVSEIEKLRQLSIDVVYLDSAFSVRTLKRFDFSQIKSIVTDCKSLNMKVYISINKMVHEKDLIALYTFLQKLSTIEIDGIVIGDLSVYVLAKQVNLESKIIYQPGTMNTDTYSIEYFENHPIKGITLSREITLEEIKSIFMNKTKLELSIIGHGYLDMFYSKRKLITNYFIYKQISGKEIVNYQNYCLNEEIRPDDFYPILEDEFGTHIFRSHKLISYKEEKILKPNIYDFFIERLFVSDAEYYDSIRLYQNKIKMSDFLKKYESFDSGFYYKPTEMIKGDNHES